jgi:hypothetical protein
VSEGYGSRWDAKQDRLHEEKVKAFRAMILLAPKELLELQAQVQKVLRSCIYARENFYTCVGCFACADTPDKVEHAPLCPVAALGRMAGWDYPCCEAVQRVEEIPGEASTLVGGECPIHGRSYHRRKRP